MHYRDVRNLLGVFLLLSLKAQAQNCLTTLPQSPHFTAPSSYNVKASVDTFLYGSNELWTRLPSNGTWRANADGTYVTKLVFWRQGFDWRKETEYSMVVTARRIDGSAPAVAVSHSNPVFINGSAGIMVGLGIPSPGCWAIGALYRGVSLDFVVQVQP